MALHNCDTKAECNKTIGGFNCSCDIGYLGDGTTCTGMQVCTIGVSVYSLITMYIACLCTSLWCCLAEKCFATLSWANTTI